jgi:hypothetical protein
MNRTDDEGLVELTQGDVIADHDMIFELQLTALCEISELIFKFKILRPDLFNLILVCVVDITLCPQGSLVIFSLGQVKLLYSVFVAGLYLL